MRVTEEFIYNEDGITCEELIEYLHKFDGDDKVMCSIPNSTKWFFVTKAMSDDGGYAFLFGKQIDSEEDNRELN